MMHMLQVMPPLHPHQCATVAALNGLTPPYAIDSTILLLGLTAPGDLIALAAYLPNTRFVAVDASPERLEYAGAIVAELGLENVRLEERPVTGELADLGPFDYILARDALASADHESRSRIFDVCAESLSDGGLACFGYPALPGFQPMVSLGAWLRGQIDPEAQDEVRVSKVRSILAHLLPEPEEEPTPARAGLAALAQGVATMDDVEILEQLLDPSIRGLHLADVVSDASRAGLHYLGDSLRQPPFVELTKDLKSLLGDEMPASQGTFDGLADLSMPRARRFSVLSKAPPDSDPKSALIELEVRHIALQMRPENDKLDLAAEAETYVGRYGVKLEIASRLLRAALAILGGEWPNAVETQFLLDGSANFLASSSPQWAAKVDAKVIQDAKERLLDLCAQGLADLRTERLPIAIQVGAQPLVHDLVRYQAERGPWVTSPLYVDIELGPFLHELCQTLDGTRDAEAVEAAMTDALERGAFELDVDGEKPTDDVSHTLLLRSHIVQGIRHLHQLGLIAPTVELEPPSMVQGGKLSE